MNRPPFALPLLCSLVLLCGMPLNAQTWTHQELYGGAIADLAWSAVDTNVVYAATVGGGVWRSDDAGQSWYAAREGLPTLADKPEDYDRRRFLYGFYDELTCIALHSESAETLYVGTTTRGLYRSLDGGASWQDCTGDTNHMSPVRSLVQLPSRPDTLYAAMEQLHVSHDGGASWHIIEDDRTTHIASIVVDPNDPLHLIAGRISYTNTVIESHDGGETWASLTDTYQILDMVISPADPNRLLAVFHDDFFQIWPGISFDGGQSWQQYTPEPFDPNYDGLTGVFWTDGTTAFVSNGNSETWIADRPLYRSLDGGINWGFADPLLNAAQAIVQNPSRPSSLLIGTTRGIYRSEDRGTTATSSQEGLNITVINGITALQDGSSRILARGVQYRNTYSGLYSGYEGSTAWQAVGPDSLFGSYVSDIDVDPLRPSRVVVAFTYGRYSTSEDGGWTWGEHGYLPPIRTFAISPWDSTEMMASIGWGTGFVNWLRTPDSGQTWNLLWRMDEPHHPTHSGRYQLYSSLLEHVAYTTTDSVLWRFTPEDSVQRKTGSPSRRVAAITIDPATHDLYYAYSNVLGGRHEIARFENENLDSTSSVFTLDGLHSAVRDLEVGPDGALYMISEHQLRRSFDRGETWEELNPPVSNRLRDLEFSPSGDLYLGTVGNGLWCAPTEELTVNEPRQRALPTKITLRAWPNPFNAATTVRCEIARQGRVSLQVYNALGQRVANLFQGRLPVGAQSFIFDGQALPSGSYYLRLDAGAEQKVLRVQLVK